MRRVAAKFVARLLTDAQKENRVTVSQELFDRSNADENFLKNVITGDETWVYGYDVETKVQSSQWMGKLSPRPKKARQSRSNVKVMRFFLFIGRVSFIMSLSACFELNQIYQQANYNVNKCGISDYVTDTDHSTNSMSRALLCQLLSITDFKLFFFVWCNSP